jgi:hypothetical protein
VVPGSTAHARLAGLNTPASGDHLTIDRQKEGSYMSRRFLAVLAAVVLGFAGAVLPTSPALAAGPCHQDAVCFYNTGAGNEAAMIDHDDADTSPGECHNMGSAHRNRASYIRNWTDHRWTVYTGLNCSGTSGPLYAETSGYMAGAYNNNIESYRRVG